MSEKIKMYYVSKMLSISTLVLIGSVWAHDDAYLDTQVAPHGGQLRMAGGYHLELVMKPPMITVYVTDHAGVAIGSEGAQGQIVILAGKQKSTFPLKPVGENKLEAQGAFAVEPELKAVVSVQMKAQESQQARFTPFARAGK
jgi:hypothetical protein